MALYVPVIVAALLGCGESGPQISQPAEPSIEFDDVTPPEPQLLVGFFQTGKLSYPEALGALRVGMSEDEARAEHARIRDPRFTDPGEQVIREYRIVGASLKGWEVVGYTLIFHAESRTLDQLDLSMPQGQSLSALTDAFGPSTGTKKDAKGNKVYVWTDAEAGLQIELSDGDEDRSICKYRKPPE